MLFNRTSTTCWRYFVSEAIETQMRDFSYRPGEGYLQEVYAPLLRLPGCIVLFTLMLHSSLGNCASSDVSVHSGGQVYREFVDPCLGSHWQLQIDPAHRDRPGRLVLMDSSDGRQSVGASEDASERHKLDEAGNPSQASQNDTSSSSSPLAIRAGEHLIVDQDSQVLRARFQAIALESAQIGQRMRVRLSATTTLPQSLKGAVISVVATGTGQARWLFNEGTKP
jgi:hypothetical protein